MGRGGKGREKKGREEKGREGKGKQGKGRERKKEGRNRDEGRKGKRALLEVEKDANKYLKQKFQALWGRTFQIEHPREYKKINQSTFQLNTDSII